MWRVWMRMLDDLRDSECVSGLLPGKFPVASASASTSTSTTARDTVLRFAGDPKFPQEPHPSPGHRCPSHQHSARPDQRDRPTLVFFVGSAEGLSCISQETSPTTAAAMGRQIRPAQVFKTVTNEMNHLVLSNRPLEEPPWYRVVGAIPPAETLVRTIPPQQRQPNRKATKPKNIYKPQQIRYREDSLRTTFYKHHPWELARPRIVLESDGKDYQHCDWSKGVRQPGIPLTGEW